jgi:2-iminobutanoate/2-iminopropanoate deaminase
MSGITEIKTLNAPAPLPVFSQAIKANGMVFCSGNIGFEKDTKTLVEGGIKAQTVIYISYLLYLSTLNT